MREAAYPNKTVLRTAVGVKENGAGWQKNLWADSQNGTSSVLEILAGRGIWASFG
jgi:hypothetical protein